MVTIEGSVCARAKRETGIWSKSPTHLPKSLPLPVFGGIFFVLPEVQFVLLGFERGLVWYEISDFFENFQIFQKKTENIRNEKNGIG